MKWIRRAAIAVVVFYAACLFWEYKLGETAAKIDARPKAALPL